MLLQAVPPIPDPPSIPFDPNMVAIEPGLPGGRDDRAPGDDRMHHRAVAAGAGAGAAAGGAGRPDAALRGEVEHLQQRLGEVDQLQVRIAELEERLDFTERMLAQIAGAGPASTVGGGDGVHGADAIVAVALALGLVKIFTGPLGAALAERIRGAGRARPARSGPSAARGGAPARPIGRGRGAVRFRRASPGAGARGRPAARGSAPMITREDIQSFLDRLDGGGLTVTEVEPNLWLARTPDDAEVVVHYAPPVVILRVRVMELPGQRAAARASCSASCWSTTPGSWCTAPTGSRATTSC